MQRFPAGIRIFLSFCPCPFLANAIRSVRRPDVAVISLMAIFGHYDVVLPSPENRPKSRFSPRLTQHPHQLCCWNSTFRFPATVIITFLSCSPPLLLFLYFFMEIRPITPERSASEWLHAPSGQGPARLNVLGLDRTVHALRILDCIPSGNDVTQP